MRIIIPFHNWIPFQKKIFSEQRENRFHPSHLAYVFFPLPLTVIYSIICLWWISSKFSFFLIQNSLYRVFGSKMRRKTLKDLIILIRKTMVSESAILLAAIVLLLYLACVAPPPVRPSGRRSRPTTR